MNTDKLVEVPLSEIVPTAHNPRHIVSGDKSIAELAESIRERGLVVPVVCRGIADGKLELLAGRRRYEAHKLLGAEKILAIVRDLDDAAALDTTVLENLQRQDLDPITEARAIQMLIDSGRDPKEIAAKIGKGYVWVYRRASLTRIAPQLLERLEKMELLDTWGAMHLEAIAALPLEQQMHYAMGDRNEILAFRRDISARDLRERLMEDCRKMSAATWRLDAIVGDRPKCAGCSQRTDATPELFHDENVTRAKIAKDATCLDPKCWAAKAAATLKETVAAMQQKHGDKLIVTGAREAKVLGVSPTHSSYYANELRLGAKKSDPEARPAILLDRGGEVTWVKCAEDDGNGGLLPHCGPKSMAEKRHGLEMKRKAWVVDYVSSQINRTTLSVGVPEHYHPPILDKLGELISLAVTFGTNDRWLAPEKHTWDQYAQMREREPNDLLTELWLQVSEVMIWRIAVAKASECEPQYQDALRVAKLLNLPEEATLLSMSENAVPEPRSWARETQQAPATTTTTTADDAEAPEDEALSPAARKRKQAKKASSKAKRAAAPAKAKKGGRK